ncbi:MAG TPA: histidine kinase [Solirubrobacteraceae bacterium]|jgi:signal transduction histidine kinase|nr:histidine kinase [Solirubrobacteraceae bacterium]
MRALRDRVAAIGRTRIDALLAIAIAIELVLECWLDGAFTDPHRILAAVAGVLVATPIAVRRRRPAGALVFASAAALPLLAVTNGVGVMLALVVLAYSVGAWLELRRSLVALVVAGSVFGGFVLLSEPSVSGGIGNALFVMSVVFAAPWLVGRVARERSRRTAAFRELAAQTAAEHEERERAAIAQERVRIGRELQDIIAHSVSAMVIGAGGARQLLRSDPDRARESILTVEQTGREALAEMRRLLGILRRDDDPRALAPQPGLGRLPELVQSLRTAGLACDLYEEGEPVDLTPGIDLVGYRVIQTALGHLAQHGAREANVTVRHEPRRLELEIACTQPAPFLGQTLKSVSERVGLYGGSIDIAPGAHGGFIIRCHLPLQAVAVA